VFEFSCGFVFSDSKVKVFIDVAKLKIILDVVADFKGAGVAIHTAKDILSRIKRSQFLWCTNVLEEIHPGILDGSIGVFSLLGLLSVAHSYLNVGRDFFGDCHGGLFLKIKKIMRY
jgi:hypothetical protein